MRTQELHGWKTTGFLSQESEVLWSLSAMTTTLRLLTISCQHQQNSAVSAPLPQTTLPLGSGLYFLWSSGLLAPHYWNRQKTKGLSLLNNTGELKIKLLIRAFKYSVMSFLLTYFAWSMHSTTFPKAPSPSVYTISSTENKKGKLATWKGYHKHLASDFFTECYIAIKILAKKRFSILLNHFYCFFFKSNEQ